MSLLNNFYDLFNKVFKEVSDKRKQNKTDQFEDVLNYAIDAWINRLKFSPYFNLEINNMSKLTINIWDAYKPKNFSVPSQFNQLVKQIFDLLKIGKTDMNFIVLLAFVIVAVLFLAYIINNKQKETTDLEEPENFNQADIRQDQSSKVENIVVQPKPVIPKSLILVIPVEKSHLIESLINNQNVRLTEQDCSNLYNATRYLCLDFPESLDSQLSSINNDLFVKQGEEETSDIYFVTIDNINEKEKGFLPNANSNIKNNAFYGLVNLTAMVSPRYRIKAYQNFNVY
jgi:hypothetical protein